MFMKLIRLGRDAEVRYTQSGTPVAGIAGAYDIGWGDKKRTQWIDCSLWGERAEKLGPHLTQGSAVVIYADDLEVEQFTTKAGELRSKLKCRVANLEFAGGKQERQELPQQARQMPKQNQYQASQDFQAPDDLDDDIPF